PSSIPHTSSSTATLTIYSLSLHDALPISPLLLLILITFLENLAFTNLLGDALVALMQKEKIGIYFFTAKKPVNQSLFGRIEFNSDRKSTRLNSSHVSISYAVFCLKKKKVK